MIYIVTPNAIPNHNFYGIAIYDESKEVIREFKLLCQRRFFMPATKNEWYPFRQSQSDDHVFVEFLINLDLYYQEQFLLFAEVCAQILKVRLEIK